MNTVANAVSGRAEALVRHFADVFGAEPDGVWRAPGRVNLIGEHTDYNNGFVLPFAIDRSVLVAVRLRRPGLERAAVTVRVASTYSPTGQGLSRAAFSTGGLEPGAVSGWASYAAGVVYALGCHAGVTVPEFDLLLDSTVPVGAGLSSSHAVEVAIIVALNDLLGLGLDGLEMARLTQAAENEFVGAPTGIMDQSASLLGREGMALFLDCRSLESEAVPLPLAVHGLAVLVMDTRVAHSHSDGGYSARRESCRRGAAALGAQSLREVPADADLSVLDPVTLRRVRHILGENQRVLDVAAELRANNIESIGKLLTASHVSLRDDFEVSCPELDVAVEAALAAGALGARMTGGGFGGSAIALIRQDEEQSVSAAVLAAFRDNGFSAPSVFSVLPAAGAGRA